jgi:KDO2-lipid IV(A) lauroyltransferase
MRPRIYTLRCFQAGLAAARILPRWASQAIAPAIGQAAYARRAEAQSALRENLQVVTGKSGAELDALCRENIGNFSRMLADYFYCSCRAPELADALLGEWHGKEHLLAARDGGKGAIVVTGHLGNWELGGILLALRGLPMTVVTLDEPSTALTAWRDAYRRRLGIKTIAVGPGREFAFVEMIQTLRRGECLAMLVDRPYPGTGGAVQFFGRQTEFSSGPALLWQHTGAPVVPAYVVRRPGGGYASFAERPVEMAVKEDSRSALAANTQAVASVFESIIRRYPEQWFNYVPIWHQAPPRNGVPVNHA